MADKFSLAKWIWHNDYHFENVYLNFFESINCESLSHNYEINISADSGYAIFINDVYVQGSQYADYPQYKVYDSIDISKYLVLGENNITITAYCQGKDGFTYRKNDAGLIYSISCDENIICCSDEKTMVCENSAYKNGVIDMISPQLSFSFKYDNANTNQRSNFKHADVQDKSKTLCPRPIKPLVIYDYAPNAVINQGTFVEDTTIGTIGAAMQYSQMKYQELPQLTGIDFGSRTQKLYFPSCDGITFKTDTQGDGIYIVLDLEKNDTGLLSIDIELPDDCKILMGYGEHLTDLRVRAYVGGRNFCAEYTGTAGRNKFIHPFKRAGLRYLQLHVYSKEFTLYYAGIRSTLYPVSTIPYFKCSDHLHNKIYDVSVHTLHLCMHEHYEDCPQREQALYTMDSRNQMLFGYYAFGEYEFAKASLRLMALSIRDDDLLEICSPARGDITIPSFSAMYLVQLYEYLLYSGDKEFTQEVLPAAKRIVDGFISYIDKETGVSMSYTQRQYWNFYEWQDGLNGEDAFFVKCQDLIYDAPLSGFVSLAIKSLSKIYGILGEKAAESKYFNLHKTLNESINNQFFDKERNIYASFVKGGQQNHYAEFTQALMVYCDACEDGCLEGVLSTLVNNTLLPITISHSIFKYDALLKMPGKYSKWVFNNVADIWGKMLYQNSSTFWETEDGSWAFAKGGSLCHGWSAVPVYLYFAYGIGVKPINAGFSKYNITPIDSGLYEIEGLCVLPNGEKLKL